MQEEVEQRIVSLMISCGKLGEQEFRKAIAKLLDGHFSVGIGLAVLMLLMAAF